MSIWSLEGMGFKAEGVFVSDAVWSFPCVMCLEASWDLWSIAHWASEHLTPLLPVAHTDHTLRNTCTCMHTHKHRHAQPNKHSPTHMYVHKHISARMHTLTNKCASFRFFLNRMDQWNRFRNTMTLWPRFTHGNCVNQCNVSYIELWKRIYRKRDSGGFTSSSYCGSNKSTELHRDNAVLGCFYCCVQSSRRGPSTRMLLLFCVVFLWICQRFA